MVEVTLDENVLFILNFIKDKYEMKDISEAVSLLAWQYSDTEEEIPQLEEFTEEYTKEILASEFEPHYGPFKNFEEFEKFMERKEKFEIEKGQ